MVENLLYVGTNPEVHNDGDDGGNEEEEGAHLQNEPMPHAQDVGGHYDNDERCAWMQTEVRRISTEQQREGVEIFGLRNDVQRGNHRSKKITKCSRP